VAFEIDHRGVAQWKDIIGVKHVEGSQWDHRGGGGHWA